MVGLAVARRLALAGRRVTVLEAEADFGLHTSGRGSWVIHSGLYYPADSFKAKLCQAGRHMLYAYCDARGVHFEKRGKIVVAVSDDQVSFAGCRSRQLCSHTLLALLSHRNLVWQVCVTLPQNLRFTSVTCVIASRAAEARPRFHLSAPHGRYQSWRRCSKTGTTMARRT